MRKTVIRAEGAPAAVGPYSHAVLAGDMLYTSGQVGLDPAAGRLVDGGIEGQTRRTLENLRLVLAAAGCGFGDVVKTTVFLADMDDFPSMNAVYATFFTGDKPARSTVAVSRLPVGALVEIDVVAAVPR